MAASPKPQGDYVAYTRHGDLLVTAGITPREDGAMHHAGRYRMGDTPDTYRDGVELAARNLLAVLEGALAPDEHVAAVLSLTVYICAGPGFESHARVADYASAVLRARLGEAGRCARAAIGVASLPGGACVELSAQAVIGRAAASAAASAATSAAPPTTAETGPEGGSSSLAGSGIPVYNEVSD